MKLIFNLFKLRIGIIIALTAVAGLAVTPGARVEGWQVLVLALSVLVSSAAAGAYNQYAERDIDARMTRTRRRPFVDGRLQHGPRWLWLILTMVVASVWSAAVALNVHAALYVFLGAFFYAVIYTVWLKRRSSMNIVIGGLAGSFAVLAGSAAVTPSLSAEALALALVLFLWTPPHFWSLAIAFRKDYEAVGVPMLPVVVGDARCARIVLWNTLALVAAAVLPALFLDFGPLYTVAAIAGGAWLLRTSVLLDRAPGKATAMANFHATLIQLGVLLLAALLDPMLAAALEG
jgi:protoheme IX farnesyltransferase